MGGFKRAPVSSFGTGCVHWAGQPQDNSFTRRDDQLGAWLPSSSRGSMVRGGGSAGLRGIRRRHGGSSAHHNTQANELDSPRQFHDWSLLIADQGGLYNVVAGRLSFKAEDCQEENGVPE